MQRDFERLKRKQFDVVVIGGGVHGACIARDASLRGMSVALVEKGDICGATSHNSLKTIHGGIRYLQHLNFKRTIESIREQKYFLKTLSGLVKPIPFVMPTYGWGMRGPIAMFFGIRLFEILGFGRNRQLANDSKLPGGKILSRRECISIAPTISTDNLTGGALWYDAQVEQADQAVIRILQHAYEHGCCVVNYAIADELEVADNCVTGVYICDQLTGNRLLVNARVVVNATGPWVGKFLDNCGPDISLPFRVPMIKSMNILTRLPAQKMAIGVQSNFNSDSIVGSTKRLYFNIPWEGLSLMGTTHSSQATDPDDCTVNSNEIADFVKELNIAFPLLNLKMEDVLYCYHGLMPAVEDFGTGTPVLHHSKVIDHANKSGTEGLVSVVSVKWTTARLVAEHTVDVLSSKLGVTKPCDTRTLRIPEMREIFIQPDDLDEPELVKFCERHMDHTMALSLTDMLLRRGMGFALGRMSIDKIRIVAKTMSNYYGWSQNTQQSEQLKLLECWMPAALKAQIENLTFWDK